MKSRTFLLLATALAAAGCSPDQPGPTARQNARPGPSAAARLELAAAVQGRQARGFEDEILRMEARIPGLGGVFFDSTTKNFVVFLKDLSQRDAAMAELRSVAASPNTDAVLRTKLGAVGGTDIRQGQFAFSELVAWQRAISVGVRVPGFLSIDADEALNRVRVTTTVGASREAFAQAITALGVPESAVVFDSAPLPASLTSLQDRVRATGGGLQISWATGSYCSLGFNVDVQFYSQEGFLTASHCDGYGDGQGHTGTTLYQNVTGGSNTIGTVSLNPAWNSTDTNCRSYTLCMDADVMYVHSSDTTAANWSKRIASTSTWGGNNTPGSLTITGWWTGISVVPFIYAGATVYKSGRTTGVTYGTIAATCENPLVDSTLTYPHVTLCSDRVTGASFGPGDSGAPVFYPSSGGDPPYAIGILFAGSATTFNGSNQCTAGCTYYFSEWGAVQTHLSRYFTP